MRQVLEFRLNRLWKMLRYPHHHQAFREQLQLLQPCTGTDGLQEDAMAAIADFIGTHIRQERLSWCQMKAYARHSNYAFFLSGSDQIWSAQWFITNRIWFLRFCPQHKRVAWMPSFGRDQLAEYNRPAYKKYIGQYAHLSVREDAGANIIKNLLGIDVPVLADPVFLLTANEWRAAASGPARSKPYILMFFLNRPSAVAMNQAKLLQEATGCELVYFSYDYHNPNASFVSGGPDAFLHMIDHAQVVLTDSFHACAFSSILHTPFYAFSRNHSISAKQMGRVHNLLRQLKMEDRYITSEAECSGHVLPIDALSIDAQLDLMRNDISSYLENVLHQYTRKEQ